MTRAEKALSAIGALVAECHEYFLDGIDQDILDHVKEGLGK